MYLECRTRSMQNKLATRGASLLLLSASSMSGFMFYVGGVETGMMERISSFLSIAFLSLVWISYTCIELFSNYESLSDLCDRRRIIESHGTVCPASRMGYRVTCVPCFSRPTKCQVLTCLAKLGTRKTEYVAPGGAQLFLSSTLYGPAQHVP